jgi:hypothetical protein
MGPPFCSHARRYEDFWRVQRALNPRLQMQEEQGMLRKSTLMGTLALGLVASAISLTPSPTIAQTAPTPTCGQPQLPTCGIYNPFTGPQVQNGDVRSNVTVEGGTITVDYSALPPDSIDLPAQVTATAITTLSSAVGNNVSAKVQNELQLQGNITQDMFGSVVALNTITTTSAVPGVIASVTNAYGNTAQAEACCGGMDVDVDQLTRGGSVLADGLVTTAPGLGTLTMASTSSGNAIGTSVTNGPLTLRGLQTNNSDIFSSSSGQVCCNNDAISVASTGVANSALSASTNSTVYSTTRQRNNAQVLSGASHVTGSGTIITSATQATGNSVYTTNQFGYTQVDAQQNNSGTISAVANLTANNYRTSAVVGATATANSILLSSQGSSGTLVGFQDNGLGADVISTVFLDGASNNGGVAQASSTAISNAITGYACSGCGTDTVKIEGVFGQTNGANTTANVNIGSNIGVGTYGSILGQGSAVGNSATFIAQRNN